MPELTVIVLTRNEERNIAACLDSVRWADRLMVLDSLSEDRTAEIAEAAGATVFKRPFVNYPDRRNAALDLATTEWVFFVDADERATPELGVEVRQAIASDQAGWWVPRRNIIWGKWIQHTGWYPDYQLRLLRRRRARYDPQREVHELVILDGPAGYLQNPLIHYNYQTVGQFLARQDRYTNFEADILFKQGVRPRPHNYVLQPWREFTRRFITLKGYRDGGHGFLLSVLMAYYTFLMYLRLQRRWRKQVG